ncbi:hypothetical protein VIOR3934_16486 [Vibrio orientalis CIP 102891 = ATCC 33934]|uniref:Uncharacterized protein n=1 Tax=Vibrio orientalis CIP 102891 = ATCC 33934 TaxID=675816 RepID=C9QKA4_VIBOR|nr:hypothetical protein [Vibrio orientalis]EEX92099.1 hypothetical protein VIA_002743 [Vibrio orientalis CIP 102891 = ATCC 33934]EGU46181.1 hypothetical protein VIOR3934_16486 [Vibrio orientalis CIP 102891 = ATCC 33934]
MNNIEDSLIKFCDIETQVRDHINTHRYQKVLISELDNWSQICSSLDTLGDTGLALKSYFESDFPAEAGLSYIYTYGLLQALFIQQDAMNHLSEAFDVPYELSDELKSIRAVRNASIGHPTKNRVKTTTYFNHISRSSMSKDGFTLARFYDEGESEFIDVDLKKIVETQLIGINTAYALITDKLRDIDEQHRAKFMEKPLADILHSTMGYMFEKVGQAIYSPSSSNVSFGLSMLESIEEAYMNFKSALQERNELPDHTQYDLDEYFHGIQRMKAYLTSSSVNDFSEADARIYLFYLQKTHKNFESLAREIDENYVGK